MQWHFHLMQTLMTETLVYGPLLSILTCSVQAKYVGQLGGGLSKNLLLKVCYLNWGKQILFFFKFNSLVNLVSNVIFFGPLLMLQLCLEMQDKKHRFYIVSALAGTKVDLKGMLFVHCISSIINCQLLTGIYQMRLGILKSQLYFIEADPRLMWWGFSDKELHLTEFSCISLASWMLMGVFLWFWSWAVLSQRLGLGKGGLRMAPEEALQELLQVAAYL